jgi:hypothetical protein
MSDLIARLETVAPAATPGDWLDVVARSERLHRRTMRRRLLVAIAVALLAVPTIAIATGHWDLLSLSASDEEVPLPQGENTLGYVIGDRVRLPGRPEAKLAAPLLAPFLLPGPQLAVASSDRRKVLYHTWEGSLELQRRGPLPGGPVLRLFDARTGRDVVFARGAHSVAWRDDGVIAYNRILRGRTVPAACVLRPGPEPQVAPKQPRRNQPRRPIRPRPHGSARGSGH